MSQLVYEHTDLEELSRLAIALAPRLRPRDAVALWGDLGAGKTAFARFLIQALLEDESAEVTSPSFPLLQVYESTRLTIYHFDFYRISGPDDLPELGFHDALADGLVLMEWPERLGAELPGERLDIRFTETSQADVRRLNLEGFGPSWPERLKRFAAWRAFIDGAGWSGARPVYAAGDASARGYARLLRGQGQESAVSSAVLMDSPRQPDGPPVRGALPYSQIAHLAEDVRSFVAVDAALRRAGVAAPEIYAQDLSQGFLLLEDFGDWAFTRDGVQDVQYRAAVEALLHLRKAPPPRELPVGEGVHGLPLYDREALAIETELLLDWFLPAATGRAPSAAAREEFSQLWNDQFDWLLAQPKGWTLRDFHSPNLIWRPDETGLARVGLIDFQDAVLGHAAYDLVSLLQDARQDAPAELEAALLSAYCDAAAQSEPAFDREAFVRAYALLGAQRNTKILGIFARLAMRDGKRAYLAHIPRIAQYLTRDLEHPSLSNLKAWFDREAPHDIRSTPPSI
jgi:tRNA threonylcarbamoyl adenosine modification protein YjeE